MKSKTCCNRKWLLYSKLIYVVSVGKTLELFTKQTYLIFLIMFLPFSVLPSTIENDAINTPIRIGLVTQQQDEIKKLPFTSNTVISLSKILSEHYVEKINDPVYIRSDFLKMANYYSKYPKVVQLITSIKSKDWTLTYNEYKWSTIAVGRSLQVDNVIVNFNTRSAAKLKLQNSCKENPVCIASPADALLHELLHTYIILLKTDKFISQGGMSGVRYSYKHEYSIIKLERELYASMTQIDGVKRPQRNEHTGRKVLASCVTCIK